MANVDVRFINDDTEMVVGKSIGSYFLAFSPWPKGVKSKAEWIGIAPANESVARALAAYFTQVADKYKAEAEVESKPAEPATHVHRWCKLIAQPTCEDCGYTESMDDVGGIAKPVICHCCGEPKGTPHASNCDYAPGNRLYEGGANDDT